MDKNILQFDTVKFVSSHKNLKDWNKELFKHDVDLNTGEFKSVAYTSRHNNHLPFELHIDANFLNGILRIEFSSKILSGNYPQLICYDNFVECLQNINALGICKLDEEAILNDCEFTKLHITKDIQMKLTNDKLSALNLLVGNYRRFKWDRYDTGIIFTSITKSVYDREEIILYDKEVEISKKKNAAFLSMTNKGDEIKKYFNGKTRIEMRLLGKKKIKHELGVPDTSWKSLRLIQHSPLLRQFNKVFTMETTEKPFTVNNVYDLFMYDCVKSYNGDLPKIEQYIKDHLSYKSRGALGKRMKKIAEVAKIVKQNELQDDNVLSEIRQLLSN